MNGSNFIHWLVALTGSVATIALILTAFGLMLGIVKPADALRRVAVILGVVMLLMVTPAIIVNFGSASLLPQLGSVFLNCSDRDGKHGKGTRNKVPRSNRGGSHRRQHPTLARVHKRVHAVNVTTTVLGRQIDPPRESRSLDEDNRIPPRRRVNILRQVQLLRD